MNQTVIYVINRKCDTDRLNGFTESIQRVGLEFKVFEALDGSQMSEDEIKKLCPRPYMDRFGRNLTKGDICLVVSHRRIWEEFLKSDHKFLVVCEDDCGFTEAFPELLKQYETSGLDFDLVKFHLWECAPHHSEFGFKAAQLGNHGLWVKKRMNWGTTCYLLTKEGAKKVLKKSFDFNLPIDEYLMEHWRHGISFVEVSPYPTYTRRGPSTLAAARTGLQTNPPSWRWRVEQVTRNIQRELVFLKNKLRYKGKEGEFKPLTVGPNPDADPRHLFDQSVSSVTSE